MASQIKLHIMGKEYQVACPEDEKDHLIDAARLLNERMEEVKREGGLVGLEKVAIMTALNLAHELSQIHHANRHREKLLDQHLKELTRQLDSALPKS